MATGAKLGYGSLLKKGNSASPEVFTTIVEVRSISNFGSEAALVDVTNLDSAGGFMEYINGMKDTKEMTVTANALVNSLSHGYGSGGMVDDHNDGTLRNFRLELTSPNGVWRFAGIIRGWDLPVNPTSQLEFTFQIKISGLIDWVPA